MSSREQKATLRDPDRRAAALVRLSVMGSTRLHGPAPDGLDKRNPAIADGAVLRQRPKQKPKWMRRHTCERKVARIEAVEER